MDIRRKGSKRARAQKPNVSDADAVAMRRATTPPTLAKQCNKIQLFCYAPHTFFRLLFAGGARTRSPHTHAPHHRFGVTKS